MWPYWKEKFLTKAGQCGYKDALVGSNEIPKSTETINASTAYGKKKEKLHKSNNRAYEDMILYMDDSTAAGQVAFQIVRSTKTTDYEHGNV